MATDPELLKQISRQAFERGEFKDEKGYEQWLRARGLDKFGDPIPSVSSPFVRGALAGIPMSVYGTAERLARALPGALGEQAAQSYREKAGRGGMLEQERAALGTAPQVEALFGKKQSPEGSRLFASGATASGLAGEVAKYTAAARAGEALAASRMARPIAGALEGVGAAGGMLGRAAKFIPGAGTAAAMGLGALEDIGSLPEESTAGALSELAKYMEMPRLASAMRRASESATGRAMTGATLGILPEAMIRGATRSAAKRLASRRGGAPRQSEVIQEMFPEGFSAGEDLSQPRTDVGQLLDELIADLPPEPKTPTVTTAGSRRRATGAMQAANQAERVANERMGQFYRDLTGASAEGFRSELGRGATRAMVPIEAEREAQQILLRRNRENAAATTTQQKAAIERLHATEDARLEGTPTGDALKRLALPVAGAGAIAASQDENSPENALQAMAPLFLGMVGPSVARAAGRNLPRLYLAHNLPAEMVARGIERGGLPAPSLAFKTAGLPHTGFGGGEFGAPVTLLGKRRLAEEVGAYTGDIYSKMYPKIELENLEVPQARNVTGAELVKRTPTLERIASVLPEAHRADIEDAVDTFVRTTPGESLDVDSDVFRRIGDAVTALKRQNPDEYANLLKKYPPTGEMPEVIELADSIYGELAQSMSRPATGREQMQAALEAIRTPGNLRMSGADVGQVGVPTSLRALGAEFLPTLESIRSEAANRIRSASTVSRESTRRADRFENAYRDLSETLNRYAGYNEQSLDQLFPISKTERVIMDAAQKASDAEAAGLRQSPVMTLDDLRQSFVRFSEGALEDNKWPAPLESSLQELHKSYNSMVRSPELFFEAKPQRVVGVDEFERAMVPSNVSPALKKQIADVLPVTEYEAQRGQQAVFKPTQEAQAGWMRGFSEAQRAAVREGGNVLFGIAATAPLAAAIKEEEDNKALEAGVDLDLPTVLAIGVGGVALRQVMRSISSARSAAAAVRASRPNLLQIANDAKAVAQAEMRVARTAAQESRAAERIRQPVGARPATAFENPKTPDDVLPFFHRLASDTALQTEIDNISSELVESGRVSLGGSIPWETERQVAQSLGLNANDLALRDPSRALNAPEFLALSEAYGRTIQRRNLVKQVMNDPLESVQNRELAKRLYDALDQHAVNAFQRLTRDRGEAGRTLNAMKAAKASSSDPNDWLYRAQKLAGGRTLSPEMSADLIRAVERGDFVKAQRMIGKVRAANTGFLDKASEVWQLALLSRLSRPVRDIISNSTNAIDTRVQYALASKIDQFAASMGWFPTRTVGGSTPQILDAARKGARNGWQQARVLFKANRELTSEEMRMLERAAQRYDFSEESTLTTPALRAWAEVVRRSIAAADQPFYESAFAMSMESQARAMAANMKLAGDAAEQFVEGTLARPNPEMVRIAAEEGNEAVFQNPTFLGSLAGKVGGRGAKSELGRFIGKQLLPFSQTPSAITTQSMRQSPLGILTLSLKEAGIPEGQRRIVRQVARMTSGGGLMLAGWVLADNGKVSGFYPDDPNERGQWQEEGKIPGAIKIGGRWTSLLGLLGPQAQLVIMGSLMRKYMEEDSMGLLSSLGLSTIAGGASAFMDTPAMQSLENVTDVVSAARRGDREGLAEAGKAMATSQVSGWIPGVVQQIASMGDVDENGDIIMREPMGAETLAGQVGGILRSGTPGLRQGLPEKVSPFGRVRTGKSGGVMSLLSPFQTSRSYESPLTQALDEVGYFPAPARRGAGEAPTDFVSRRKEEGAQEQVFLQELLSGSPWAWQFVSNDARDKFEETGDKAALVRSALASYKSARTRERKANTQ